jgi:hypothetical protein
MKKFISVEKLSKKKRRELNKLRRKGWGDINPVTRKPQNPKAYNRKKAQRVKDDFNAEPYFFESEPFFLFK